MLGLGGGIIRGFASINRLRTANVFSTYICMCVAYNSPAFNPTRNNSTLSFTERLYGACNWISFLKIYFTFDSFIFNDLLLFYVISLFEEEFCYSFYFILITRTEGYAAFQHKCMHSNISIPLFDLLLWFSVCISLLHILKSLAIWA